MKTEIYYFTGTGNGLHIAKSIKESLQEKEDNIELIAINKLDLSKEINSSAQSVGIVYPTYAMTSPLIVKAFARQLNVSPDAYTFLYAHCGGGGIGSAINSIVDILKNKGIKVSNTYETTFPSNSALVTYTEEKLNNILKLADEKINNNTKLIVQKQKRDIKGTSPLMRIPSKIGGAVTGMLENALQFKNIEANDDCIGCGLCHKVCPVDNIEMVDGKPQCGNNCEMCFSCINNCPKQALSYKKMKKSKLMSYRHPNIKIKELMYR